ncbi:MULTISPECIES: helix-turn-helix transcriptional regulator [Streptomyces]|uniref:Helix-turn-helix transcriptional regulator n=1 Tax=Streptomyces lonegramiae TaxID=3075524 RepID=A0ABU2XL27_9ACTN|nr:helix-turn-helix transcriptional regulator [Streptomyces sp. DSM 41529]MDT0546618.1 helix-turn-helix transcriptional regulator [Streptomyces sp. DSM 41529]
MGQRRSDTSEAPRQAAVALTSSAGRRLATELRRIKMASGLSFARLEARTNYSRASLERYVNGKLFPSRDAVEDIAQACGADTKPLLELWDDALEAGVQPPVDTAPSPETAASPSEQPERGRAPRAARRRLLLSVGPGLALLLSLGLALLPFSPLSPFGSEPSSPGPTTGCRDYDAEMRAYAVGTICWKSARATVTGYVKNPEATGKAVAQLCISNRPNVCSQTIDLAVAGPGGTSRYRRTVTLPAGHGVWVRACAEGLCTQWD